LTKILWKNANKWQLAGAMIGVFLGFALLMSAIQFYFDVQQLLHGGTGDGNQFVQINKKVNIFNTLGAKSVFSAAEIQQIEAQPFVQKAGAFEANQFEAGAYSDMLGFYTELFFESVPPTFLDVDEPAFRWSEGQKELPILMSKEYLALYNFGFAPGRGLPQLTPSTIERFSLDVKISGNGQTATFKGKVVGFSDRINSILIPNEFMAWANGQFANGDAAASKLILQVDNPMSREFQSFLKEKGYEVSAGKLIGGQFGVLFNIVMAVIATFGTMILLLAILVFSLNFQVLIARASKEIGLLLQIGYPSKTISHLLDKKFSALFLATVAMVFVLVFSLRTWMVQYFENQGFNLSKGLNLWVWLAGLFLTALLLFFHIASTRRSISNML
jgi:hypothetical protein